MTEIRLDGNAIRDKERLHRQLAAAFEFPSWYGANLDALYDCLTDIHAEARLVIAHSGRLLEDLGPYGERLFEVLRQAQEDNPRFAFECER